MSLCCPKHYRFRASKLNPIASCQVVPCRLVILRHCRLLRRYSAVLRGRCSPTDRCPMGLSLNSAGTISGTPAKIGAFAFTAQVTDDSGGRSPCPPGSQSQSLHPRLPSRLLCLFPAALRGPLTRFRRLRRPGGSDLTRLRQTVLCPQDSHSRAERSAGTPTTAGNASSFTVTVTDSSLPVPLTANSEFQIAVGPPPHTDLVLSCRLPCRSHSIRGALSVPVGTGASVSVASSGQPLSYSFSVTPAVSWLDVTTGGNTPGNMSVSLNPRALTLGAGTVQTSIVVTCITPAVSAQPSPCAGSSQAINVALNVVSAPPLLSVVGPTCFRFSAQTTNPQSLLRNPCSL